MFKKTVSVASVAALCLALTSCTSTSADNNVSADGADGLTPVTVGVLQIATSTTVQLAIDEGIFEKHGLDVSLEFGQGGAALLPAVSSGSMEFAVGNPLSLLTAESQGLEMSILSGYSLSYEHPTDPEEFAPSALIVQEDSGIETWSDLEGKRVATNTLQTQGHLTTLALVDDDGGDSAQVEFNEIASPDQLAQLEQGNIDAMWVPEPFLTMALNTDGTRMLGDPLRAIDDLNSMVTFSSRDFATKNPDLAKAFTDSIAEAAELAMSDEAEYVQAISDFSDMEVELVESLNLEYITAEMNPTSLHELNEMAVEYGFLDQPADLDALITTVDNN